MDREKILYSLREREKELNCIYAIEELLKDPEQDYREALKKVLQKIPEGWQFPEKVMSKIILNDTCILSEDFYETQYYQRADIIIDQKQQGLIEIHYKTTGLQNKERPFLPEEYKLLNTIAGQISHFLFHKNLKNSIVFLKNPDKRKQIISKTEKYLLEPPSDEHWSWRLKTAQLIAEKADFDHFKVKAIYIIGSAKNAKAGPASDLDLLIHTEDDKDAQVRFKLWLEGWGYSLAEINFQKTGIKSEGSLIDIHFITDKDIEQKNSFATMINSIDNSARLLRKK